MVDGHVMRKEPRGLRPPSTDQTDALLSWGASHSQTGAVISFPESCFQQGTVSSYHSQSALGEVQTPPGRGRASGSGAGGPDTTHAVQKKRQIVKQGRSPAAPAPARCPCPAGGAGGPTCSCSGCPSIRRGLVTEAACAARQ